MQHIWLHTNTFIFEIIIQILVTSTTRSFRVDTELSKIPDEESERMGVSVNALVNMILKRYSNLPALSPKIDLVVVNRELLKSLFDSYPDEDIYGLGVSCRRKSFLVIQFFSEKDIKF